MLPFGRYLKVSSFLHAGHYVIRFRSVLCPYGWSNGRISVPRVFSMHSSCTIWFSTIYFFWRWCWRSMGHKYSSKLDATVFLQVFGANHQDIPTHVDRAINFITNKLQEPLIFSVQEQLISSVNAFAFNQAGYVVSTWPKVYRPWSTRRPLKIHQWDLREKSYFPPTSPSLHSQYLYPRIQILDFVKCLVDIKKSTVRYRQVHSVPFYRVVWLQGIFQYSAEHIPIL